MTQSPRLPASLLTLPIAHRAYHNRAAGRPENSRAAMRAAIAAGYGIELDLQLSADGVPMVFHDDVLDRLTARKGAVSNHTAAELGRIQLLDAEDGIPTLTEILQIIDGQVPLLVEIKDQTKAMAPVEGTLERATAKILQAYTGDYAIMSFNPHSVALMAELLPDAPRGLTTGSYDPDTWGAEAALPHVDQLRQIADYDRTGASFISHEWRDLGRPRVAELKAQGADILCWTLRSPTDEATARQIAANVTFEDYPAAKA